MTRTDSLVVGTLVVLLALIAGLVGVPSLLPTSAPTGTPIADPGAMPVEPAVSRGRPRPTRLGQPAVGADPGRSRPRRPRLLRARPERPERDDRARPGRALVGRPDRARSGRSSCATTPRWHDGEPVTAEDVAFTIRVLQDPDVHRARRRLVERGHASHRSGRGRSSSRWRRRSAGSSRPRPSRSRRRICWPTSRSTSWSTTRSAAQPIGSGPFAVASLDDDTAELVPAASPCRRRRPAAGPSPAATDSLAHPGPTEPPEPAAPVPDRDRVPLLRRPDALADAYRAGDLDARLGPVAGR